MTRQSDEELSSSPEMIDACEVRTVDLARVERARAALPLDEETAEAAHWFSLLADPARLKLLIALRGGEMCVCDLAAACGQGESSVSHALRLLRTAHVVRVRRVGRMAFYRLADEHVRTLLNLTLIHQRHDLSQDSGVIRHGA
jgi:DNA-binding transcriptional ArsR family regulator